MVGIKYHGCIFIYFKGTFKSSAIRISQFFIHVESQVNEQEEDGQVSL